MSKMFKFEVVTPTRIFYQDEVEMIIFSTNTGEMGVMADHEPMLIANTACTLQIKKNKKKEYAFISEGLIEVTSQKVKAIVDTAQWPKEIDIKATEEAKKLAEEKLENPKQDLESKAELVASIERATNKLKTVRKK